MSKSLSLYGLVLCLFLVGCTSKPPPAPTQSPLQETPKSSITSSITLVDVTAETGIDFVHQTGARGKFLLPETMTGGVALLDYDNDGLLDIYFCSGRPLLDDAGQILDISTILVDISSKKLKHVGGALYRNLGNWRFVDVTESAGLGGPHYGLGVTAGDYDNDGWIDLFLSNYQGDLLFHNAGDGHFIDATSHISSILPPKFSAGASFFDANQDGLLDLFVARYVQLPMDELRRQYSGGRSTYSGPQDFPPDTSSLLINTGQAGEWLDASLESGIGKVTGTGMGCVTGDFDGDGDGDIFVANDEMPNYLYRNVGQGKFEEAGLLMGAALNALGKESGSMGVDAGDLDGDGRADLFVTTFENELVNLFRMTEQEMFQEITRQSHVGEGTLPHVTWGCSMADLDSDGDRDLYIATGHLDQRQNNAFYKVADIVMQNLSRESGQFKFENVTSASPGVMQVPGVSRGTAVGDLDRDGDQDVVVVNLDSQPAVLANRSASKHWLKLKLVGTRTNRDAVGAKVRIASGKLNQVDEVRNGRGYQSYWGGWLHFGLGDSTVCDQIEIIWPGGQQRLLTNVPVDQMVLVVEK